MVLRRIDRAIKDLKCTAPKELSYRIWDAGLRKSGLHRRVYGPGWMSDKAVFQAFGGRFSSKSGLCQYLRSRKNVAFFFPTKSREKYASALNDKLSSQRVPLLESAEKILMRKFDLMGQRFEFDSDIDWHFAGPGGRWPLAHWGQLNVNNGHGLDDVRPLWELNRHQHFTTLGRAYWWTGDEKYARGLIRQLKGWLTQNPPELGINWQSNLEIAIRSISWSCALHFFLHSDELDDDTLFDWIRAFIHSAYHLNHHISYSRHCMRNNHFIGDAAGLALIAQIFPELTHAKAWRKKALKILYSELFKQVYEDGVNWEQTAGYHSFVLYLYLLVIRMEGLNSRDVPAPVWSRFEKMFDFLLWKCKPDGSMPMIGDSDDAKAIWLGNETSKDLRPSLSTGAVLFDRGDYKYVAGQLSEETIWLLGLGVIDHWEKMLAKAPGQASKVFSKGGYYMARSGWDRGSNYILLKNGPHSTFHAHADQLHMEFAAFGKDLLIDPGTFIYNGDTKWRNFFRSTRAHNTVSIDGLSQSDPYRSFRWLSEAKPLGLEAFEGNRVQWITGGHMGYRRLKDPVTHRRGVLFAKGEYAIVFDEFAAKEKHNYQFCFHFPPGHAESQGSHGKYARADGTAGLIVYGVKGQGSRVQGEIVEGEGGSQPQGWVSYRYGVREPAPVLVYEAEVDGAWRTGFVLWPLSPTTSQPDFIKSGSPNQTGPTVFTIGFNGIVDTIYYSGSTARHFQNSHAHDFTLAPTGTLDLHTPDPTHSLDPQSIITDSEIVFLRIDTSNQTHGFFTVNGSNLSVKGILHLSGNWRYVELDIQGRTAFLSGAISGGIKIMSELVDSLKVDKDLDVQHIGHHAWVVRNGHSN